MKISLCTTIKQTFKVGTRKENNKLQFLFTINETNSVILKVLIGLNSLLRP